MPSRRNYASLVLAPALVVCACAAHGLSGEPPVTRPLPFQTLAPTAPGPEDDQAWVILGADTVVAEVASTPQERERGLMFRESVPDGTGMLFVFGDEAIRGFWMDNTYVDLDIAFMDASYRIVDIQQLEAMSTEVQDSRAPFMYALEVRRGWLAEHGVEVGDVARIEMRSPGD
jgi:uncharacterized membrane protein (UPF0127 family)